MVYNTEMRRRPQDLNHLDKGTLSVGSKGSDKVLASNDKSDVKNLYIVKLRSLGSKGADRAVSDESHVKNSKSVY